MIVIDLNLWWLHYYISPELTDGLQNLWKSLWSGRVEIVKVLAEGGPVLVHWVKAGGAAVVGVVEDQLEDVHW